MGERNFYDPPYVSMIDSGTFWRCPHGKTRWASKPGCGWCALRRPRRMVGFIVGRLEAATDAIPAWKLAVLGFVITIAVLGFLGAIWRLVEALRG